MPHILQRCSSVAAILHETSQDIFRFVLDNSYYPFIAKEKRKRRLLKPFSNDL